jgi:hypothetical protein
MSSVASSTSVLVLRRRHGASGKAAPGQLGRRRRGRGRRAGSRCRGRGAPLRRATLPDFEVPEADPLARARLAHGSFSLARSVRSVRWYVPGTVGRGPGQVKPPPLVRGKMGAL